MIASVAAESVEAERRPVDGRLRREYAPDGAGGDPLEGDVDVVDAATGEVVAFQRIVDRRLVAELRREVLGLRWDGLTTGANEFRLSGIKNAHRTFGFTAPVPLRRRFGCSRSRFTDEHPECDAALDGLVADVEALTLAIAPDRIRGRHDEIKAEVLPEWRLDGTAWTSGIINWTSALPYHRDAGNFAGGWSAMLALRRHVRGGHLHLAEYDRTLAVPDCALVGFDGQAVMHAVTPLRFRTSVARTGHTPYRVTIVWYAKTGMRTCCPPGEAEIARARRARTASEERIADEWLPT